MALEGTLKDFSLADIFQLIGLQRKTGILTLQSDEDTVTITFNQGMVVGAESVEKRLEDRLGRVLVKRGTITDEQLEGALEIQKETLQRLGYVLVKSHFILPEELRDALVQQIQQIIYRLFRWHEGYYHFRQEKTVHFDRENITPLSAETILMEGVRMLDEWPHIERLIGSFHTVYAPTDKATDLQVMDIDEELQIGGSGKNRAPNQITRHQAVALEQLDGTRDVQGLIEASKILEFELCKALAGLVQKGIVAPAHQKVTDAEVLSKPGISFDFKRIVTNIAAFAVVVVVLAYVVPRAADQFASFGAYSTPRWDHHQDQVRRDRLRYALVIYHLINLSYPEDLGVLIREGYLPEEIVFDHRGQLFRYTKDRQGFTLRPAGRDGDHGTEDDVVIRINDQGLRTPARFFRPLFDQSSEITAIVGSSHKTAAQTDRLPQ